MADKIITQTDLSGLVQTFIIIDHGNAQFTSMLKSEYDAQQVKP